MVVLPVRVRPGRGGEGGLKPAGLLLRGGVGGRQQPPILRRVCGGGWRLRGGGVRVVGLVCGVGGRSGRMFGLVA